MNANAVPVDESAEATVVQADGLVMRYGAKTAVKDISFSIRENTTVGLLGPNGAGKSTTMRMLAGYRVPTSGTIAIAGYDIRTERCQAQAHIGYLPEIADGFGRLTTAEFLTWCCEARDLRGQSCTRAIAKVCRDVMLAPVMASSLRQLSKGWRQRVWLGQALLHDPKVLILDEPTDGLDPIQKRAVRLLIRRLSTTRVIILSTHILEEAEEICDRVIIIADGCVLADRNMNSLPNEKNRLASLFYALIGES